MTAMECIVVFQSFAIVGLAGVALWLLVRHTPKPTLDDAMRAAEIIVNKWREGYNERPSHEIAEDIVRTVEQDRADQECEAHAAAWRKQHEAEKEASEPTDEVPMSAFGTQPIVRART